VSFSSAFHPLRRRSVLLVWGAGLLSDVGTWVQLIVVGTLVAQSTGSALATGMTALALFTPQGVCAPIGGLLADRYDRRAIFVRALLAQSVATMVLAVVLATGERNPFVLSAIIVCSSAAGAIGQPAYAAMLPDLVPPEELMAMISLGIYSWNGGRILGPLIGAVMVQFVGPAWTVAFNAATFLAMSIAVSMLRRPFLPPGTDASGVRDRLAEGWAVLKEVPGCRYGIGLIVLLNLTVAPFMGLIPIFVRSVFDGGASATGMFSALQGVGAIVGSLAIPVLATRTSRARLLLMAGSGLLVAYAVYALAPTIGVAAAAIVWLGAGSSSVFVTGWSIVQRDAPAPVRGRIVSISQAAMGVCYGLGILWIGAIGDTLGLRVAFVAALVAGATASWLLVRARPGWRAIVDGVEVQDTIAATA
jgi:MFS family permease